MCVGRWVGRLWWWIACGVVGLMIFWGAEAGAVPHRWTPTYGSPFGINIHTLGWDGNATVVSSITDLGVGWIRVDFDWLSMEPSKGQYNWAVADGLVDMAVKHQLNVYATLAYAPNWAASSVQANERSGPKDPADWSRFVQAVVSRYKGKISHWGIWNEPNLTHFLWFADSTPRAQRIQTYLQTILLPGSQAVKAADPDAVVVALDLAHLGGSSLENKAHAWQPWLEEVLKQAKGSIDVISHHTYQSDYMRSLDGSVWPWEYPSFLSTVQAQGAAQKPIWITEIGWKTDEISEAAQATEYTKMLDTMLGRAWWKRVFPYELRDDPNIPDKWGIVRADGQRKPAWTAYRDLIKARQPVPRAGAARTVKTNTPVSFDGSASTDPDGQIVKYAWDFDHTDGVGEDATGAKVTHTFAKAGVYQVTLTVTDNHGIAIGTRVDVTVQDGGIPPIQEYPVAHAPAQVVIDGDLPEWSGATAVRLDGKSYVKLTADRAGDADLSVEFWWMWSSQGLYFAARVKDDQHVNNASPGTLWMGDSLQVALDADADRAGPNYDIDGDYEYGLALLGGKVESERTVIPQGANPANLQAVIKRQGDTTIYEIFFPSASISPLKLQSNAVFFMSLLFNDDDGNGRKGYIEWTPGIGQGKDPRQFKAARLMPPSASEPTSEPTPSESNPPDGSPQEVSSEPTQEPLYTEPTTDAVPSEPAASETPADSSLPDAAPSETTSDTPSNTEDLTERSTSGCTCETTDTAPLWMGMLFLLLLWMRRARVG
ncbi:PKD domain-containing protein [Myxococcota bacterium]|nr:PKD domain-containing protein [Myxococcota bacterium]